MNKPEGRAREIRSLEIRGSSTYIHLSVPLICMASHDTSACQAHSKPFFITLVLLCSPQLPVAGQLEQALQRLRENSQAMEELKQKAREREGEADRMEKALSRAQGELIRREKELSELRMTIARLQHGANEVTSIPLDHNFSIYTSAT